MDGPTIIKLNARIPEMLKIWMDSYVAKRQAEYPKYSLNDCILDGLRALRDGGTIVAPRTVMVAPQANAGPRKTMEELATIPGVQRGIPGRAAPAFDVGDTSADEVHTKPWLPELKRLREIGSWDQGSADEEFRTLLGVEFKSPKGWAQMPLEKQARYLDQNYPLEVR